MPDKAVHFSLPIEGSAHEKSLSEMAVLAERPIQWRLLVEPGSLDHLLELQFDGRESTVVRLTTRDIWAMRSTLYRQLSRLAN